MAGRHGVKAQTLRALEEQVELDMTVALDARVGRASRRVTGDEGRHDVTFELLGVVEDVMVDPEHLGDTARVVDVGDRTTARVRDATPELQRGANDLVPGVHEEPRRDRRVNAAAHRHQYFHDPSLPAR